MLFRLAIPQLAGPRGTGEEDGMLSVDRRDRCISKLWAVPLELRAEGRVYLNGDNGGGCDGEARERLSEHEDLEEQTADCHSSFPS